MKKSTLVVMNLLVFIVCSEIVIALFTLIVMYGIRAFFAPITFPMGIIFYTLMIFFTGLNIIWMTALTAHWKRFFNHIFQTWGYIWPYIRIFLSWFTPGITISQEERDEANDLKRKTE